MHGINNLPAVILIGRQTETGVEEIAFDCSGWLEKWPGMQISILAMRPGEADAYPAAIRKEGAVVVWEVNASDTAIAGDGYAELIGLVDGKRKLSRTINTRIVSIKSNVVSEVPEAAKPWVDQVLEAAKRAEDAAERAEGAGGGGSGGSGGITKETDPTVPAWAKQPNKPTYTAEEVGAQPKGDYALKSEIPSVPVQSVNGKTGAVQLSASDVGAASKAEVERLSEEIGELSEKTAPITAVKELFEDAVIIREQANIFPPEYVRSSRYDYTTGNVYWNASSAIRNATPVKVSGDTQYSFQEFVGEKQSVSFFFYDASGVIIGEHLQGDGFEHFTTPANAVSLNFHIAAWDTNHPDEEPKVMIWKTDSADKRTEFIPFAEDGRLESVELPKLQVPKYEKDEESILAMKKASFDYGFNYIAYSKISGEANSINTAEHFEHCAKLPFDMLKGDVRPTSDGGVIMCHDAGFTLDSNGDIIAFDADNCTLISEMTEAECLALKHAATGNYVCNLDKFLSICKRYGKVAYITIRDEHIADVVVPTMMRLLDKYHMRTRCIVNSFTTESLQAVRAMDEYIMLSRVCAYASGTAGITKEFVDSAIGLGNCRVVIFCFSSSSTDATVLDNSAEAIAYAIENDVRVDTAQVADGISISDLLARGITGAQMTVAPDAD